MKSILLFLGLVLVPHQNTFSTQQETCTHKPNHFSCVRYLDNYDADTISFNIPDVHPLLGQKINVRVLGVDTPEMRTRNLCEKKKAQLAKVEVAKKLKSAKRIDLVNIGRDKYFRILADVVIDGQSLSKYLLEQGLAYPYDGGTKKKINWCLPEREIASENQRKKRGTKNE